MIGDLETEVTATSGSSKDCFVHELRVQCHNILARDIDKAGDLKLLGLVISFVHIVRSVPIRIDFAELYLIRILDFAVILFIFLYAIESLFVPRPSGIHFIAEFVK